MKNLCAGLSFLTVLIFAGCSTTPIAPGVYKDWEGELDSVEIVERFHLPAYQRILVLPVDARAVVASDNRNTRSSVDGILADATKHLAEKLQSKLPHRAHIAVSVAAANTAMTRNPGALIFKPTFTQMDAGSQTGRIYSMGMGGKTKITLVGEFIDGGTGRTLVRFSKTNSHGHGFGPYGLFTFNSAMLEANEDDIIDSVGELLKAFYP